MHTGEVKKGVPNRVLRYFPIIPRLKRMFRTESLAKDLRWHFSNRSSDGKLRHPVDSVTWVSMDAKYPSFAAEQRNLRLGLSTDGFNPFSMKTSRYSSWPMLLVNYNMAPDLCMKEENIMLSLLIPGPHQPDNEDDCSESDEEENLVEKDEEELSRWKKRSIFYTLPYWEELPVRHNLDVMHVEKNVASSLIATLLHCGNSKDGLKARKDLEALGIRKNLHPKAQGKRTLLPAAPWSLLKTEKKLFCKRLFDFKGPDGYCSNISSCVSLEESKVMGLKSHDYHVLMQQLLPVAIRGLLPKGPRLAIFRLCVFFNLLCQRVIDMEQIQVMETEIVETLCMFERFWPPSFFDIMVHLCVHLGREARLGGPVHFRWMYPFERYMKVLKDYVRNPARPEGCIAESYLSEECMRFCAAFLKKTTNVEEKAERNTEYESKSILEGRPLSAGSSFSLTEMEKKIAHLAVIQNTALVEPYVVAHLQHSKTQTVDVVGILLICGIRLDAEDKADTLKWLAYGPRSVARSFTGYIVNGLRFHTNSVDRLSRNSGVYYEATAMCRSSAKDTAQVVDLVSYYGKVVDIILLDYNVFYVPIFWCHWAVRGNGVKVKDGFTLVNMNQSQASFSKDPFILASQARQIFYSRDNDDSSWYVAMRGPSRRYSDENDEIVNTEVGPLPSEVDMGIEDLADGAPNVRDDCEGIYV
ncbi:unnamed protein product [Microthlaspi erraticum]|uniref:DUF4218 domain-containing protein n=1 Tax=Microthlaspi erraticum TaxID=1685480 RepID=A0A6D2IDT8_9BRAS|nr:unnamed protein product [Microthlaspi erraticum]